VDCFAMSSVLNSLPDKLLWMRVSHLWKVTHPSTGRLL
jgi:hypothetical protein